MEMDEDGSPSSHLHPRMNQNRMLSPTDDTDDGTIDNDRVEYAVLLPDSFAVLDWTTIPLKFITAQETKKLTHFYVFLQQPGFIEVESFKILNICTKLC